MGHTSPTNTDLGGERNKLPGAKQPLHTHEQGDTKTRPDFALVNEAFFAAASDFEVVQRNLVPWHQFLKITLNLDAYDRKCG